MGQKDITEKLLEDYNDVFADIINGLIFKGEQRILPESLENAKVHSQYKAEDGKVLRYGSSLVWQKEYQRVDENPGRTGRVHQ